MACASSSSNAESTRYPRPSKYLRIASTIKSSSSTMRILCATLLPGIPMIQRQMDPELCSAAFVISCMHGATVLVHDSLHDGQPETGPAAAAREERLEDPREVGGIEARPMVAHADDGVISFRASG